MWRSKERHLASFKSSVIVPWASLATLLVAMVAVAMLVAIYVSGSNLFPNALPAIATSTTSSHVASTTTTTTITPPPPPPPTTTANTTCRCRYHSSNNIIFPYGSKTSDYLMSTEDIVYPVNGNIIYTLLGDNRMLKPLEINVTNKDAAIKIRVRDDTRNIGLTIFSCRGFVMRLPLSGEQQKTYHRKASSEDKTIFDCLIPNFQTQEAYIFTWVDSITTSGSPIGNFQIVVAFAADSTTYIMRNYGNNLRVTPNDGGKNNFIIFTSEEVKSYEIGLGSNDMKGTRTIFAASKVLFGNSLIRVTEQEYGAC
ncbi:hypothetical protein LSH36_156g07017 [Paralvinella palmiformis]|uniref:Uncharacterized protein n=1 Tax=Paralvinella palmiformis TaxID=53620 RepID=A0AAD9JTP8_9ANNE|nr:hypothetical protein LSH36_156g07017 [Paralvinella palmiformis]